MITMTTFCGHVSWLPYTLPTRCRFEQCHLPLAVSFPAPKINRDRLCGAGFNGCRVIEWVTCMVINTNERFYKGLSLLPNGSHTIRHFWFLKSHFKHFNGFLVAI